MALLPSPPQLSQKPAVTGHGDAPPRLLRPGCAGAAAALSSSPSSAAVVRCSSPCRRPHAPQGSALLQALRGAGEAPGHGRLAARTGRGGAECVCVWVCGCVGWGRRAMHKEVTESLKSAPSGWLAWGTVCTGRGHERYGDVVVEVQHVVSIELSDRCGDGLSKWQAAAGGAKRQ